MCARNLFYVLFKCFRFRNLPQTKFPRLSSETSRTNNANIEIPHVLQGEIARLDKKFRITYDSTVQTGSKILKLICYLNDPYLPSVPPIFFQVPEDYPLSSPSSTLLEHEMNATQFLECVQKIFAARLLKMPALYSLSHLLDTWEMSIRQACSPNNNSNTVSATSVALGV